MLTLLGSLEMTQDKYFWDGIRVLTSLLSTVVDLPKFLSFCIIAVNY